MHGRERIVNNYLAERLRRIRREQRISLAGMAERVCLHPNTCQQKETGVRPVGLDYLLRFQLATGIPIQDIWFPVSECIDCLDDEVIKSLLKEISRQRRTVTEEDVIEIAASVFQVPAYAITGGYQHRRIVQARTAAALAVRSHPLLKTAKLAWLVRRTTGTLRKSWLKIDKYGPEFWRKVEAVQRQVDEL